MGAGASIEAERERFRTLFPDKPEDGSDIKDFEQALAEIISTRKIVKQLQAKLREQDAAATGLNVGAFTNIMNNRAAKRAAVMDFGGDKIKIGANFVPKIFAKSETITTLLRGIVSSNILFSGYTAEEQAAIVAAFEPTTAFKDTFVIRQDTEGDVFYVVESGSLDIFVKNEDGVDMKVSAPLGTGNFFGELALMYNTKRAASIKANTDCQLWRIDRDTYRSIVLNSKWQRNKQYMDFLKNVEITKGRKLETLLGDKELEQLTALLHREVHEMGEVICRQGNIGDTFYIIAQGDVSVRKMDAQSQTEQLVATLHAGDYFGEQALLRDDVRQATCYATTKVITLTLGRDDFISLMGTVEELLAKANANSSGAGGSLAETVSLGNIHANVDIGAPFDPNSPVSARSMQQQASSPPKVLQQVEPLRTFTLSDFTVGRTLGCGAFGRVKVCTFVDAQTKTESHYALKCQSKMAIVKHKLQQHVVNEIQIMKMIQQSFCPFIVQLVATMQDSKHVYIVTELLQGGELFTYLRDTKRLAESSARFYSASCICAFQALHSKAIAYRDLKPENIVMTKTGYVKLIDLGLAKQVLSGKTYTLCGTPDYLAPEVILNEGHDTAVDYWALGVLIYEMVIGLPPFYAKDPLEVYEKILSGEVKIHSSLSVNCGDLLKKLLTLKPSRRIGTGKSGITSIMKQKWFSSFDWARLQDCSMNAPYVPALSGDGDVSHFDQFDEGAEPENCEWTPEGI